MFKRCFAISVLVAGMAVASGPGSTGGGGGGTGVPGVTPPGAMEVRTLSERIPAGGTVQVKFLLTQPRPITSGGSAFATDGFNVLGVSLTSPLGDTAGTAVSHNGTLYVSAISPLGDFGTNLDYPFMTIALEIPATTPTGTIFPLAMPDATFQGTSGPLTLTDPKPGTLTIGGSVSIYGVFPGGGTRSAGTVISVLGTGFQPTTKIATKMKISTPVYVSPTEMRFSLQETTTMDQQPIQVTNPDGSQVVFYSYLRGTLIASPSHALLRDTDPIFQTTTHGVATIGPLTAMGPGQYTALAIQNPTDGPVAVTFQVQSTGATTIVMLPSSGRVIDDLSTLLGGAAIGAGDIVTVTSTSGVQILGLNADDVAYTVAPFLPAF